MTIRTNRCAVWIVLLPGFALAGEVHHDQSAQVWTLRTGAVEYRLRPSAGTVYLDYFGPAGRPAWPTDSLHPEPAYDISGLVQGQGLRPQDLRLVQIAPAGSAGLQLLYRHQRLPLDLAARYAVHGDTGVITR